MASVTPQINQCFKDLLLAAVTQNQVDDDGNFISDFAKQVFDTSIKYYGVDDNNYSEWLIIEAAKRSNVYVINKAIESIGKYNNPANIISCNGSGYTK